MQRDSFKVIKEVILGSLPFHGSFLFLVPGWDSKQILPKGKVSIVLVTCCYPVFRHIHKVFVLKTFHLQVIKLRAFPFPHTVRTFKECHKYYGNDPTSKGRNTVRSRTMAVEHFRPSLVPGSSNVQVAGSAHATMAQKCNGLDIWGQGEEENQSSNLKRLIFRSTSSPITSYVSQNLHSQTAKADSWPAQGSYALLYAILSLWYDTLVK